MASLCFAFKNKTYLCNKYENEKTAQMAFYNSGVHRI